MYANQLADNYHVYFIEEHTAINVFTHAFMRANGSWGARLSEKLSIAVTIKEF